MSADDSTSRTTLTHEAADRLTPPTLTSNHRTPSDAHEFRRVGLDTQLRRVVDVDQLKSGKKEDDAEELIIHPTSTTIELNEMELDVASTGSTVLVQKAVVHKGNLFKPTQSAAVMSDAAQVKSPSSRGSSSVSSFRATFILVVTTTLVVGFK